MTGTARLGLPFLSAGQAQKELVHNEALQTLDAIVAGAVEELPRSDPPPSPAVGAAYIVGPAPTGAWAGQEDSIAAFTSGGWRLITPQDGVTLLVRSTGVLAVYRTGSWEFGEVRGSRLVLAGAQVVGPRAAAIASATGGTTVDTEARAAVDQILGAMRQHGLIAP